MTKQICLQSKRGRNTVSTFAATISCTFDNQSSANVQDVTFIMTDDSGTGDPVLATVTMDQVPAGTKRTETTTLPTGVEKIALTFSVEGEAEPYANFGLGNNAEEVNVTFTD